MWLKMGYEGLKNPSYIFLTLFYLFIVPIFVVGSADFYEFEPIPFFVLFGMLSATDNVRLASILAAKKIGSLCSPKEFYKLALSTTLLFLGAMAAYYYLFRTLLLSIHSSLQHLPSGYGYYPWLYIAYFASFLYFINFNLILLYNSDLLKAKELLVDTIPKKVSESIKYLRGGANFAAGLILGFGVGLGVWLYIGPILYLTDFIEGREKTSMPLNVFVPKYLMLYSLVTLAISILIFTYVSYKILTGNYYSYEKNCTKFEMC